jgi:hypothetical protein
MIHNILSLLIFISTYMLSLVFFRNMLHEHFYMEEILDHVCSRISNGVKTEYDNKSCIVSTCENEICLKLVNGGFREDASNKKMVNSQCVSKDDGGKTYKDCSEYIPPSPVVMNTQPSAQYESPSPNSQQANSQQANSQQANSQQSNSQQSNSQQGYSQQAYSQQAF